MRRRDFLAVSLASLASGAFATPAWAKYPERAVRLIIPRGAGGVLDVVGRHWCNGIAKSLGALQVAQWPVDAIRKVPHASVVLSDAEAIAGTIRYADEARQLVEPACILLDLSMPGLNGLELQERLAEKAPLLPIVFLTGRGNVEAAVQAMKAGAQDFLEKPTSGAALLSVVERALDRYQERRVAHGEPEAHSADYRGGLNSGDGEGAHRTLRGSTDSAGTRR